ncbi:ATP-dependent RNA helicase SUV3L [Hibiscus syriacus]|uniref:RNA helicase n=1 Tax=Hibiscus syriacus TaxID=106335 RepID=A0A6A2XYR5_HIBSY|nr:ATP-dependent RNA helicase SUV3L [Hibiscus syriacus]
MITTMAAWWLGGDLEKQKKHPTVGERVGWETLIGFTHGWIGSDLVPIKQFRSMIQSADLIAPHTWFPLLGHEAKIIYHRGPTNSGKTYNALQRYMEAKKGIYCSPLRLLAMEVFDKVNAQGVYCSLLTGQEKKFVPFSNHVACTVEMMSTEDYDVAVIDEIQMMSDPYRCYAWTSSLLGLISDEIHLCGDPTVLNIVRKICSETGDELHEHHYDRFKPLVVEAKTLLGDLKNVRSGDCVVAFSRREIFEVKMAIEKHTSHRCCVIYGALPPKTRRQQANCLMVKIMNSILSKYNGYKIVAVPASQVKQIAGRAGRRGSRYPDGLTTTLHLEDLDYLINCLVQGLSLEDRFNFCFAPVNIRDPKAMYYLFRFASAYNKNVPVSIAMGLPKGSAKNDAELLDLETKHQVLSMKRADKFIPTGDSLEAMLKHDYMQPAFWFVGCSAWTVVLDGGAMVENEDYEVFVAQNSALASWLLSTISPSLLPHLVGAETAAQVWKTINKIFACKSTTTTMNLHYQLKAVHQGDLGMRGYIFQVKEICDALASCGSPMSKLEHIATILNGLSAEYRPVVTVLSASRDSLTLEGVVGVLIDAKTQQKNFNRFDNINAVANVSQVKASMDDKANRFARQDQSTSARHIAYNNQTGRARGRVKVQCQLCGKNDHLVNRYWYKFDKTFSGVDESDERNVFKDRVPNANICHFNSNNCVCGNKVNMSVVGASDQERFKPTANVSATSSSPSSWFVNSGATHHIMPDATEVMDGTGYTGASKLTVGNGNGLCINKIGRASVFTASRALMLSDLLHVPSITKKLVSVSKRTRDNGVFLEFHADHCVVRDERTGAVLLRGRETDGLYEFGGVLFTRGRAAEANVVISSSNNYVLWHDRLGHPSCKVLVQVCKQCNINLPSSFNKQSSFGVYRSVGSWTYCIKRFSILCVVYRCLFKAYLGVYAEKQRASCHLFQRLVRTQFGKEVKAVQSDWGGEYRSLSTMLAQCGIHHRVTCPHTSQQNGVVGRKHRHLFEMALTLLARAALPLKYWSFAVVTAAHLINRLPSAFLTYGCFNPINLHSAVCAPGLQYE